MNAKTVAALAAYLACIPAANWMIDNIGTQQFPGGPHTIPVGFGYSAPSGVLLIGAALVFRDVVQRVAGKRPVLIAIGIGVALSYLINPALATASAVAFALGELADFAVFTPLAAKSNATYVARAYRMGKHVPMYDQRWSVYRPGWLIAAVVASGVVGGIIDTFVFLQLAFGSTDFWQGQLIGKTAMSLLGGAVIWTVHALSVRLPAVES